jgi:hypothetical protein
VTQTYRAPAPIEPLPVTPERAKPSLTHRLLHKVMVGNWVPMGMKDGRLFLTCQVCGVKVRTFRKKSSWQWGDTIFTEIASL